MAQSCCAHAALINRFVSRLMASRSISRPSHSAVCQISGTVLCLQVCEGLGHAIELQRSEGIKGWVCQHFLSFLQWKYPAPRCWGVVIAGPSITRQAHANACAPARGRGGFAALAIQSILRHGMQGLVGIAVDVQVHAAGRDRGARVRMFWQPQDAQSSISLLWMSPLAHDHLDKGLDWARPGPPVCGCVLVSTVGRKRWFAGM